jgi:hypothetical protein
VIRGLLLVTAGSADSGEAIDAWDESGRPIVTIPDNDAVVPQLKRLSPPSRDCYGIVYEAAFAIRDKKTFHTLPFSNARLVNIVRARISGRSENELRKLIHEFDMSASIICRAAPGGKLQSIPDTYVTGSKLLGRK